MRTNFPDVLELLARKSHKVLMNMEIYFALDFLAVLAQQFEIREKSARNGVLDGHDGAVCHALFHRLVEAVEGGALHYPGHLGEVSAVVAPRGFLMEGARKALYCNSS